MIQITTAARALAQMRARQAVKDQLKRQGLKPTHYSAKEISALAREYLLQHRDDLMLEAAVSITAWIEQGDFGKRAQRAAAEAQCEKIKTYAQNISGPKSATSA